jgi:nitrate reductase alpha subunit
VPYITLADRATPPFAESKPEWEIFSRLSAAVAAEARRRGVDVVRGFRGQECALARLDERFGDDGRFGPHAEEDVLRFILSVSGASRGVTLEDLRRDGGAVRIRSLGPEGGTAGIYSEYSLDEPVVPLRDMLEKKRPYPTLSGRQQFYVDHPWFLELGEELPAHKEPPAAGGAHPFTLTGGHTRWSIHAIWRDHALLLRLQRGEPVCFLAPADCAPRSIADGDRVRVWNDAGAFEAVAKLAPGVQPGEVIIYHAWEPHQHRGWKGEQEPVVAPWKAIHLAGGYGQLHYRMFYGSPGHHPRGAPVEVERA